MGALTRKFVFCAALALGGLGLGGTLYTNNQAGTSLNADYGRAAQCEQKEKTQQQACSGEEQKSLAVKQANEANKEIAGSAVTAGVVLGVLALLAGEARAADPAGRARPAPPAP